MERNAVQPGQSIAYTATIKNELDGRVMNGLLQAELPVDIVRSTEVMDTLQPLQSITMTGAVNAPTVAQSTVTSLTLRAGVVISGGTQAVVQTAPGPVFYLDEFNSSPTSGYNAVDDSGNNHTVSCASSGLSCASDGAGFVNNGFDFTNKGRLSVTGQNSLKLGANDSSFSMVMWINPEQGYSPDDMQFQTFGKTVLGNNFFDDPKKAFPTLTLKDGGEQAKAMTHFGHGDGQGYCRAESGNILDYGQWQHLAVSFDGAQFSYYVNGALVDTQSGENCVGQSLYPAKSFTIGHSGGLSLRFKQLQNLKSADNDEGYLWSNDNRYQNGVFVDAIPYPHLGLIWRSYENEIDGSGPLNLTNDADNQRWAVTAQSSLTYWLCNRDEVGSNGCLDGDNNDDEPVFREQGGNQVFERTHSQFTPAGPYTAGYDLYAGLPFPINKWAGDLTYNLYNHDFKGKLDEIALYNTNLSAAEVEQLYFTGLRVADLTFDEPPGQSRFADSSASNSVATCSGATCPDSGIPGRDNQALRFDGNNDYVELPMPLGPTAQQFTAAAWFKLDNTAGSYRILQQLDGSGTGRYWLSVFDGQLRSNLGGSALNGPANGVTANVWHHAAVSSDGSTARLFLDGVEVAAESRTVEASDGALWIGANKNGNNLFDGLIDEVIVQRGALNAAGVQRLMAEATLLNLHLDEDLHTTTFTDDSPYRNDATCTGTACPATGAKGQMREAATFDGNDKLTVDISNSGFDPNNYSVALWIRPTGSGQLVKWGSYDYLNLDGDKIIARFLPCNDVGQVTKASPRLPLNKWSHIVFTANRAAIQSNDRYPITLYVNGAAVWQHQGKGELCTVTTDLDIGWNIDGSLDEFAVYGKALRDDEVRDLYNYQSAWFDQKYEHQIIIDVDDPQVGLGLETSHLPLADTLLAINAVDTTSKVSRVQVTLTAPGGGVTTVAASRSDDPGAESWFYLFEPTVAGQYTINLLATDGVGNTASSSKSFYVDGSPPAATLDGSLTAGIRRTTPPAGDGPNTFSLFGDISDSGAGNPAGVDGDSLAVALLDWRGAAVQGFQPASDIPAGWQLDYPFAQPAYGQYAVRLSAADAVGNVYSATLGTIVLDDLPPTGDIALPGDVFTDTAATLTGTAGTIPYPGQSKRLALHFEESAGAARFVDAARNHAVAVCAGGCPAAGQSGRYGSAVQFGDGAALTVTSDLNPLSDTFTVLAWVNPGASTGAILSQTGGDDWLALSGGNLSSSLGGSATTGPTPLALNSWQHAAVSFDGEQVRLYLNGTLEISATRSAAFNDGPLVIGAGFSGLLDELVVYDTPLTAEQIYDIANPLDTGITAAQLRFRHLKEADQSEAEGDWLDVTLDAPGQNYTTWTLDPPGDLEGPYRIDLKVTSDLGVTHYLPNMWGGDIDLLAPRLTLDYSRISPDLARAGCYAYDYNITQANWRCPAGPPTAMPETADWYVQVFTATSRTTAYSVALQAVFTSANTLTACDVYDHCATLTGTTSLLPEAVAIPTPAVTSTITGLVPVEISGYGHSESDIAQIGLTVDGQDIFTQSYGSALTETTFAATWTPPAWGVYEVEARLTNGLGQTITDPTNTVIQVNAPQLTIAKTVEPRIITGGESLTYTIAVLNGGNLSANNVRITDTLPASLDGADLDETVNLAPGEAISYTLPATSTASTYYVLNTAWVSHTWERKAAAADAFRCDRFEVFTDADSGPGSLRHAIDNTCGESLITFAADFTIRPESVMRLDNRKITIDGQGHTIVILGYTNQPTPQFFQILPSAALTLSHVTVRHNSSNLPTIRNLGALTVLSSTIRNSGSRGAIQHDGSQPLIISHSYFFKNHSIIYGGGALRLTGSGPVSISHSLFRENSSSSVGGAIYNTGSPLSIRNSTFYGNYSGAIVLQGGATEIIHSTFANNFSGSVADIDHSTDDPLLLANSILGDTLAGDNCRSANPASLTVVNSLIETGSCGGTLTSDPQFWGYGDYGGALPSLALLPGSPAIDAGDPATCPADDQRGQPRPFGAACDLGAVEMQGFRLEASGGGQSASVGTTFTAPLSFTLYSNVPEMPVNRSTPIVFTSPAEPAEAGLSPAAINTSLDSAGHLEQYVTANSVNGSYVVTATVSDLVSATFALTNTTADLVITKTLVSGVPVAGQLVTYTLAFSNTGDATTTGVVIRDYLPSQFTIHN